MQKVAAAIIKSGNNVLLMRRAPGHSLSGQWEYPGGKAEPNERVAQALKRELKEELGIDAQIGKLITSVKYGMYEIYAYDVKSFTGNIMLNAHDDMKWVPITEVANHPQLPADKKISQTISKQKDIVDLELKARVFAYRNVVTPTKNEESGLWTVKFFIDGQEHTESFKNITDAFKFFISKANEIIINFKMKIHLHTTTKLSR